ncbi:MAG TPA: hypothetical protein VK178_04210 [Opitutaceae bacterium]|nr:hypothetical protein [Opitutaceae bacterium]
MDDKRLELKLPAPVVGPLLEYLLPLARETGEGALAFEPDLKAIEADFRDDWRADLANQSQDDQTRFAAIFDTEEFRKEGIAEFGPEDCEPLLRAASALRLKLRTRKLGALADSALENGEIDFARMNKEEQTAITAYMLLASLQEIVIRHLDPSEDE